MVGHRGHRGRWQQDRKSVPRLVAAKAETTKWYDLERQRLVGKLKTMLAAQAGLVVEGMQAPATKVRAVLFWWLDHQCPRGCGAWHEPPVEPNLSAISQRLWRERGAPTTARPRWSAVR